MTQLLDFKEITYKRSKLKQLRQSKRLTLKQLSLLSGISLTRLTKLEREAELASKQQLESLMNVLECSSGDILYIKSH